MERIGDIFVARGIVTPEQVEAALRQQVFNGGRLGTNLVDLFNVDLDAIAEGLAVRHQIPAAMQKHFDLQQREIALVLAPEVAQRLSLIPLCVSGEPRGLFVAGMDPLSNEARSVLEQAYQLPVAHGIAPELRILYHLENTYGIERENRFRRPRPRRNSVPPGGGAERRSYASELQDPPKELTSSAETALGKIAVKKMAMKLMGEVDPGLEVDTPENAVRSMRRVNDRDKIGQLIVTCLHQAWDGALNAGLVFILREHLAICWQGFARHSEVNLEGLGVPVDEPGLLKQCMGQREPFFGVPAGGGSSLDRLLWDHLRCGTPAEIAVLPIELADQVGCLIYAQSTQPLSDNVRQEFSELASGVNAAFRRLVRASER